MDMYREAGPIYMRRVKKYSVNNYDIQIKFKYQYCAMHEFPCLKTGRRNFFCFRTSCVVYIRSINCINYIIFVTFY